MYGDDIVSAETDSDGYFIVHTRQGKTIKTALKPLVDAKASADKAKISETNAKKSETNSANSAAAALASQEASANSQTKAKTSENNAKTSELNAKASENNAKTSETNAKNSATAAAGSASVATTQAENSSNSATASRKSATASADSASVAHTSEVNASSSASAASVSAGKAKSSETNAKTYETNAKASELNAKASETNAKSSENLAKAWAMSESSPDGVDGNKSAKTWAGEAKVSASSSASSASASQSSATASASSASDAKVSETNAAKSATAAAQSAENAKLFDPTAYARLTESLLLTEHGKKIIESEGLTDLNSTKCISYPSWYCRYAITASSIANCPTKTAFHLFNFSNSEQADGTLPNLTTSWYNIIQILIDISGNVWRRAAQNRQTTTFIFSAWVKVATTSDLPNLTVYATKTELENGFTTASLTVSGETSVPTPSTENNSKTIANTEFVHGVVNNLVNGAPTALDTLQELATALGNDPNFSTTILNKIGEKESKTDAQIEHKKLQNEIDLSIKGKAAISADADSNPPTVSIPNDIGMYPIVGYPTGSFDSAIDKPSYRHGLVMNFKGQDKELFSLYSVDNKPYLYFRTGYVGWGATWYQIATTEALNALGAKIPAKVSQLTDDVGIAKMSNGHLVINGSELWIE